MVSDNSFVRLQNFEIYDCPVLDELIVEDQEESKFLQLQYLEMACPDELTSTFNTTHDLTRKVRTRNLIKYSIVQFFYMSLKTCKKNEIN